MIGSLCVLWDFVCMTSDPELAASLNLYQFCKHLTSLPGDSLRTFFIQLKYQRLFEWLSIASSWQAETCKHLHFLTCLWAQCWWKLILVCNLVFFMHTQAQQMQSLGRTKQVAQTCSIWHLTAPESLPRKPRINTPNGELHTTSENDPFSFTSNTSRWKSWLIPDLLK